MVNKEEEQETSVNKVVSGERTTIVFPNKIIKNRISGQARIEGYSGMGEFLTALFIRAYTKKE